MKVKNRMSENPHTVTLDTSIHEAMSMMKNNSIRRLPIVDNNRVVGIVTVSDLIEPARLQQRLSANMSFKYLLARTKIEIFSPRTNR